VKKNETGEYILKVLKLFKSVRFSAVVIALLILIYFLGLVLPQKWMFLSEAHYVQWKDKNILNTLIDFVGFTNIYVSPVTITLLALFFLNLLVVTLNRVPVMMRRAYLTKEKPVFDVEDIKKKNHALISAEIEKRECLNRTINFFRKKRWSIISGSKENTFLAIKNRLSPIGFLLFHFSFILCLVGGLLITYTRFSGEMALTEGQEFKGDMSQFHRILNDAKILKELPPLLLRLDKVRPYYEDNVPTELIVYLDIGYKDELRNEVVKVNEPVNRGAITIISQSVGVSPLFIIKGAEGQELDGAYVSLNVLHGKEDSFRFDTFEGFKFNVRFYPDYIVEDGVEKTRSIELKNPAMHLTIEKKGKKISEGTIRQGEYIRMGPDTEIGFREIRYWTKFLIVREYGKMPLIAGFLFASIGLIMRLVFYQRRIRVAFEYSDHNPVIYMDGRSEYFMHSFKDEMRETETELEEFLGKPHFDKKGGRR
jgi:cytochrome c biogenesis protein ResB